MFSCEVCKILKNTFFHRTPPVAASVINEAWTYIQRKFKFCLHHVKGLRWWESQTVVPVRNKGKRLSLVNHWSFISSFIWSPRSPNYLCHGQPFSFLWDNYNGALSGKVADNFIYALNFVMLKEFYEISTNSRFLVYSRNSIKLSWTAAFKGLFF